MSIVAEIREAALYSKGHRESHFGLERVAMSVVYAFNTFPAYEEWDGADSTTGRTFLLLVAEALEAA
jgi:hypothetical protein